MARFSWYGAGSSGPKVGDDEKRPASPAHSHSAPDAGARDALSKSTPRPHQVFLRHPTNTDHEDVATPLALAKAAKGHKQGYPENTRKDHKPSPNRAYAASAAAAALGGSQKTDFMAGDESDLPTEAHFEHALALSRRVGNKNKTGAPMFAGGGSGGGY